MRQLRLPKGKPKCTILESFDGMIIVDNVHDIVDKFNAQDIVEKRSLTIE